MATISVSLPDALFAKLREQLRSRGYSVEDYVTSSLMSLARASDVIDPETEAKLLEGLDSPLLESDEIDWAAKVKSLKARRQSGAA
jgi:hypothetical protein